jgi:redox-sensitive bicupin YhaK (pirin superfamily)
MIGMSCLQGVGHVYHRMESNQPAESEPVMNHANDPAVTSRPLSHVVTTPPPAPGFIGEGHTAVEVLAPSNLAASDPFVLLMDDRLDIAKRRQIGGAHPHAGIETVTLIIEGTLHDRDEGTLGEGDVIWMTAGRGIIHNEAVEAVGRSRVFQLWIALPAGAREERPRFEIVRNQEAPVLRGPGVEARLYSGSAGSLRSPTRNVVPIIMMDVALAPSATFREELPAAYNGFAYVVEGMVEIGGDTLAAGQVGWLAPSDRGALVVSGGERGARLVLYAGLPIGEPLVQQGPFVAGSRTEIADQYRRFRAGQFESMHDLAQRPSP